MRFCVSTASAREVPPVGVTLPSEKASPDRAHLRRIEIAAVIIKLAEP
jgi:hypothetical protein